MKAYECDICGTLYKASVSAVVKCNVQCQNTDNIKALTWKFVTHTGKPQGADVCPECLKKLAQSFIDELTRIQQETTNE